MIQGELLLEEELDSDSAPCTIDELKLELERFDAFGKESQVEVFETPAGCRIPVYINEFWTSKQRAGSNLHEVSYRACFKPQLPLFFIERLTFPGAVVYDPFMGRGTTLVEAALNRRIPIGCDINPLSKVLVEPRMHPPTLDEVAARLESIDLQASEPERDDLLVFYHPETLVEIASLRDYFLKRQQSGKLDGIDKWIRMVATNRLTGHSPGFFSVYSLPPNQAVTVKSQTRINEKRKQVPPRREVARILLKKAKQLLKISEAELSAVRSVGEKAQVITASCDKTPSIQSNSVDLVVTSPPFLDEVDYATDNWLRCWFNGIDEQALEICCLRKPEDWQAKMTLVFKELFRVLKVGGHIAFEVGEVKKGKIKLEDLVVPAGIDAGLQPELILINSQNFTKTSNCWGVDNQSKGTNTNRIILLRKVRA